MEAQDQKKSNALLNLIKHKDDDEFLIRKREKIGLENHKNLKAYIKYSNNMQDVYKNIGEYNAGKLQKIFIVFDDMVNDMISNKIYQWQKIKHFFCFYYTIILRITRRC